MVTFIEPLWKDPLKITFGWNPEPNVTVSSYNVYCGLTPTIGTLAALATGVGPTVSQYSATRGKVVYNAAIADVQTLLSIASTKTFANTVFYFAITYLDENLSESSLADSTIVTVYPVGIDTKQMKEDPSINRHIYSFSDEDQRWIKTAGSNRGGVAVDNNEFYLINTISEYTYDASGNTTQIKTYLTDSTIAGSPAKLKLFEYNDGANPTSPTKITVMDSTV